MHFSFTQIERFEKVRQSCWFNGPYRGSLEDFKFEQTAFFVRSKKEISKRTDHVNYREKKSHNNHQFSKPDRVTHTVLHNPVSYLADKAEISTPWCYITVD